MKVLPLKDAEAADLRFIDIRRPVRCFFIIAGVLHSCTDNRYMICTFSRREEAGGKEY